MLFGICLYLLLKKVVEALIVLKDTPLRKYKEKLFRIAIMIPYIQAKIQKEGEKNVRKISEKIKKSRKGLCESHLPEEGMDEQQIVENVKKLG